MARGAQNGDLLKMKDIVSIAEKLKQQCLEIDEKLATTDEALSVSRTKTEDLDANVQVAITTSVQSSHLKTLRKQRRDINKALARIKDGTYGMCKYCEDPISIKRLQVRPTSNSCVECKKMLTNEC